MPRVIDPNTSTTTFYVALQVFEQFTHPIHNYESYKCRADTLHVVVPQDVSIPHKYWYSNPKRARLGNFGIMTASTILSNPPCTNGCKASFDNEEVRGYHYGCG